MAAPSRPAKRGPVPTPTCAMRPRPFPASGAGLSVAVLCCAWGSRVWALAAAASVLVVGAGLAGLAAARQLLRFGLRVLVVDGRARPGGCVYTAQLGGESKAAVDLGGSVITSIFANPLGVLARQLGLPLHKVRDRCPLYYPDGRTVETRLDRGIDLVFNALLDHATRLRESLNEAAERISLGEAIEKLRRLYHVARTDDERMVLDWHFVNLKFSNAGCLLELSLAHWDQDDPFEMGKTIVS